VEPALVLTRAGNKKTATQMKNMADTFKLLNVVDDVPVMIQWQTIQATFKNYDFMSRCSHSSMPVNQVVYDGATGYDWMLVNGWYKPHHTMLKGVFQKWRFVNGASHRYLGFNVPDACEAWAIASDGVYYETPRKQDFIALSLGARMDVLISCTEDAKLESEEPDWYTTNQYAHIFGSDPGFYEHHFMTVNITQPTDFSDEDKAKAEASDEIRKHLNAGSFEMDHGYFGMDLREGTDAEWAAKSAGEYVPTDDHTQSAAFYNPILSESSNTPTEWYNMNGVTFSGRIARRMRLNEMQIWNITHSPVTKMGHKKNHNWHLHSYHFQIMYALDMRGNVYTESPMKDWVTGDWRDTVSVPANGTIFVRFRPTVQKGLVLHHCHIYNHETAGMKEMHAVIDCDNTTLLAMKDAVCTGLSESEFGETEDATQELDADRKAHIRNLLSMGASMPTTDNNWPWVQQDTEGQCKKTIDYLCSDGAMVMSYSEELDWVR